MAVVEIPKPEKYNYVFSSYLEPVAKVNPGDTVIMNTEDAMESRMKTAEDLPKKALASAEFLNPQTGPIYIEGAEPGDTLVIKIDSIVPSRDYAISAFAEYFGGLTSTGATRFLQEPLKEKVWVWKLIDNEYYINDEIRVKVPLDPFVGTLATAPKLEAISSLTPGPFGGNMDVRDVKPGNTVLLPIYNKGALVFTGDCHGNQGEGECCGFALETTAKCTFTFDIIKGKSIKWPRIISKDKIMTVGSARPMEDAARIANVELCLWMEEEYGFTRWEAYELLCQVGGLYVGNMVDTTYSLVANISKEYLQRV